MVLMGGEGMDYMLCMGFEEFEHMKVEDVRP
jgi:hypothetical protein